MKSCLLVLLKVEWIPSSHRVFAMGTIGQIVDGVEEFGDTVIPCLLWLRCGLVCQVVVLNDAMHGPVLVGIPWSFGEAAAPMLQKNCYH